MPRPNWCQSLMRHRELRWFKFDSEKGFANPQKNGANLAPDVFRLGYVSGIARGTLRGNLEIEVASGNQIWLFLHVDSNVVSFQLWIGEFEQVFFFLKRSLINLQGYAGIQGEEELKTVWTISTSKPFRAGKDWTSVCPIRKNNMRKGCQGQGES